MAVIGRISIAISSTTLKACAPRTLFMKFIGQCPGSDFFHAFCTGVHCKAPTRFLMINQRTVSEPMMVVQRLNLGVSKILR